MHCSPQSQNPATVVIHHYFRNKLVILNRPEFGFVAWPILMFPWLFFRPNRLLLLVSLRKLAFPLALRVSPPSLPWLLLLPSDNVESWRIKNNWSTSDDLLEADSRRVLNEFGTWPTRRRIEGLFAELRNCSEWYCRWKSSQLSDEGCCCCCCCCCCLLLRDMVYIILGKSRLWGLSAVC